MSNSESAEKQTEVIVLDETTTTCPVCLKDVPTRVIEKNEKIFLEKHCEQHGTHEVLMSEHPWYYKGLRRDYYSVLSDSLPQNNFYLQLHFRCNLRCPICLDNAGENDSAEFDMKLFKERFKDVHNQRVCILGGEPTEHENLPEVIRYLRERGNRTSVATNGINAANMKVLENLKKAGLDELRFQIDGFREETNQVLRGCKLTEVRLKAIENAEKLDMNINLAAVVKRDLNEDEIWPLVEFALKHEKVKEMFFVGLRALGRGGDLPSDEYLVVDQVIDMAEKNSKGKINRKDVFDMQRLFYLFYRLFNIRQCFYNQFLLLIRKDDGGFWTFNQIVNMPKLQKKLDRTYRLLKRGKKRLAGIHLFWSLGISSLNRRALSVGFDLFRLFFMTITGWNAGKIPKRLLAVGFVSACDRFIYDKNVQHNCAIGSYTADQRFAGTEESSAAYALRQERLNHPDEN